MLKKLVLATALSLSLSNLTFAEEDKGAVNVAVVNIPLIMSELPQAKNAAQALQKEFEPRRAELEKIQTKGMKLEQELKTSKDPTKLQRELAQLRSEFDLKAQALQEDSQKKQRDAELELYKIIQEAINRISKERGLDLVLRGESVVFAVDRIDISDEVIARASKLKSVSSKSDSEDKSEKKGK
jgi:outer membrane protein